MRIPSRRHVAVNIGQSTMVTQKVKVGDGFGGGVVWFYCWVCLIWGGGQNNLLIVCWAHCPAWCSVVGSILL